VKEAAMPPAFALLVDAAHCCSINASQSTKPVFPEKQVLPQHTISVLAMMRRVMLRAGMPREA
jgi:hypothetical protein